MEDVRNGCDKLVCRRYVLSLTERSKSKTRRLRSV